MPVRGRRIHAADDRPRDGQVRIVRWERRRFPSVALDRKDLRRLRWVVPGAADEPAADWAMLPEVTTPVLLYGRMMCPIRTGNDSGGGDGVPKCPRRRVD